VAGEFPDALHDRVEPIPGCFDSSLDLLPDRSGVQAALPPQFQAAGNRRLVQPRYRQKFFEPVEFRSGQRQIGPELHVPRRAVHFVESVGLGEKIPAKERRRLNEHARVVREPVKVPVVADERRANLARLVCQISMTRHDVGRGLPAKLPSDFHQAARQQEVVRVQKSENFPGREMKTLVERMRRPAIALRNPAREMR